ncbi:MAG: hypothetical protein V4671_12250 [Armatimonadota bacterium]
MHTQLDINPKDYPGGIAAWGALDPVFNTAQFSEKEGVHIHARKNIGDKEKSIDATYDIVCVALPNVDGKVDVFQINGEDATHYNIAAIFKIQMTYLRCPDCGEVHSDRGYEAVHPHLVHRCKCGSVFKSPKACISNPIMLLKELCGDFLQDREVIDPVGRKCINSQRRQKGGKTVFVQYQIWGSNPAILWTRPKPEEGGIHVHMFLYEPLSSPEKPTVDQTYGRVKIDGITLDPEQIRYLMAQQGLNHLYPCVQSLNCPSCSEAHFDRFEEAVTPHSDHVCEHCGTGFRSPKAIPLTVSNPAFGAVQQLRKNWEALADERRTCYTE